MWQLDEASVACQYHYGWHLIVYNPLKAGGKYHIKLCMMSCLTSWIALNYRLHCGSAGGRQPSQTDGEQGRSVVRQVTR